MRELTIKIEKDWESATRRDVLDAFNGKHAGEVLSFVSPGLLLKNLTANRWELIELMLGAGELSAREVARRAGRDVRRVHDDLKVLESLGLIEKTDNGVVCPFDRIRFDLQVEAA